MILAFDTLLLSKRYRHSGIHEYAKNLFVEFRQMSNAHESLDIRYFVSPGYSDEGVDWCSNVHSKAVNTSLLRFHRMWQMGVSTAAALKVRADMIFSPGPTILPSRVVPVAVTIHDAMPAKLPASIIPKSLLARTANWISAKWSQQIFTDSENSKRDLVETYDLQPGKVSVIYLGYNASVYKPLKHDSHAERRLVDARGIRRPYILHHGMVQHRKNLVRLIQAYRAYQSKRKDSGIQLVLAGGFGWGADEIRLEAQRKSGHEGIIFTGPLRDSELAELIQGASLCVIPSLYEGFCLPLVEAMACGTPTIASNNSCIPEVSGRILRYFDPFSVEEMAARIEEALEDTSLREELRQNGLKRASEFSWKRCAQETLHALMGPAT